MTTNSFYSSIASDVRGFSMMELLVVIFIIGIIAGFGLPNYGKSIDRALARDMVNNLRVIGAGQEGYKAVKKIYYYAGAGGTANQAQLNLNLGLNLISQKGVTYSCTINTALAATNGFCDAVYPGRWTYRMTTSGAIQPPWSQIACQSGTCPAGVP